MAQSSNEIIERKTKGSLANNEQDYRMKMVRNRNKYIAEQVKRE